MSAIVWTQNEDDVNDLEGMYVKEEIPAPAIKGVNLSGAIMAGCTVRGPANVAIDISGGRVEQYFGARDYGAGGAYVNKIHQALLRRTFGTVWGVRVAAASASKATKTFYNGAAPILRVDAFGVGLDGLNIQAAIENATDGTGTKCDVPITYRGTVFRAKNLNYDGANDNGAAALAAIWKDGNLALVTFTKLGAGRPTNVAASYLVSGGDGAVATPVAPAVANQGAAGADARSYKVVARTSGGIVTAASPVGSTATGHAAPDGVNFNRVTATAVAGAYEYLFYRTAGGPTQGLIGVVSAGASNIRIDDTGLVADGSAASAVNNTADLASTDYTGAGKAIDVIAAKKGVGILGVVGVSAAHQPGVNAALLAKCPSAHGRMIVLGAADETVGRAAIEADAALYRHDRAIMAVGHRYVRDPGAGDAEMLVSPVGLMMSILSQSEGDQHPGREAMKELAGDTIRLYNSWERSDYIALKKAGVCALEQDEDEQHVFVSGVTTSLVEGRDQITRRRTADALILAIARALKFYVKETNTVLRRLAAERVTKTFLADLKDAQRMVENFSVVLPAPNPATPRRQEIQLDVDLINHILGLLLRARIGESVEIQEAA